MKNFLAFDLGAESGRAILGSLEDGRLVLEELHRFPNQPVRLPQGLYWDTLRLFYEIEQGLSIAGRERKVALDGVGIDTWGVDFGLLGPDGSLVDNPRHYRDARTDGILERTFAALPKERIFAETGIQFMQLNSLYQLYAAKLAGSAALGIAGKLLFMPDLFNYWLTGIARSELSIASTSQFYNPARRRWATELFEALGLPTRILAEVVEPGTLLGPLLPHVSETAGLGTVPVYATCCHDTASAVAAVPARGGNWCYISSGTWSLMGIELREPLINSCVLEANFTNELGAGGTVRFLKNIAGLWLWQECRRAWRMEGREYSYSEMSSMAAGARPFSAIIDPDAFLQPGGMPRKIAGWCRQSGQEFPSGHGELCRAILEGLALRYRQVLEGLESLTNSKLEVIHIVGGGSKNRVLNQFVADATGRTVIAGPAEATAAGNILVQAIGAGVLSGLNAARELVRSSFELETYAPAAAREGWDAAYEKFTGIRSGARRL